MGSFFELVHNQLMLAYDNLDFVLLSVVAVIDLIMIAYGAECIIAKKTGVPRKNDKLKIKRMTLIAILSALSTILMLFKFPVWFAPSFYTLDASEIPVVLGAFALGPVAGLLIEFLKILLNLLINGTTTAFVGELANFLMGSAFVIPATAVYFYRKTRKRALLGLLVGALVSTTSAAVLNAYVLLPKYVSLMSKDISYFIAQGTEKNKLIDSLSSFIFFAVIPFNLLKYVLISLVIAIIYKYISRIIKQAV